MFKITYNPVLSCTTNTVQNFQSYFLKIHLVLSHHSLIQVFWKVCFLHILQFNFVCVFLVSNAIHMTHPSCIPCLDFPDTLQAIEIMQLLGTQVSAASCHLLCPRFKHTPVHSVLTWPQTMNSCITLFLIPTIHVIPLMWQNTSQAKVFYILILMFLDRRQKWK